MQKMEFILDDENHLLVIWELRTLLKKSLITLLTLTRSEIRNPAWKDD